MRKLIAIGIFFAAHLAAQTTCLNFPTGLVPFSSIAYVTAANGAGDHLVVGALANGMNTLSTIPLPESANQLFCDGSVQLASQQFFPGVYVPSAAERGGNFAAFAGLLVNPTNGQAYPAGIIPSAQLGAVFAFRIGPVQLTTSARGWSATGNMTFARSFHAAVRLPNQKVLVCGGNATECELYDPATGIFTQARGVRAPHGTDLSMTLLNDGRALIVGGNLSGRVAELYDPVAGTYTLTGAPTTPRAGHSATLLTDGRVLIVGSARFATPTDATAAEIYDPRTGTFTKTGSLTGERYYHSETLLPDGRVLIAGGIKSSQAPNTILTTAEVWSPLTGQFTETGSMSVARAYHNAFMLANKKVQMGAFQRDTTMETYDPGTGAFSIIGELNQRRGYPSNTFLPNGLILIAGGFGPPNSYLASTELFNPLTGESLLTGSMAATRDAQTATVLFDGRVLITGGFNGLADLRTAEIYTPVVQGLVTSQTGLTFRAAQGGGAQPAQVVAVLSPTDTIPYNVSVKTFTGGNWLRATPTSGTSGPGAPRVNLSITADATGLAATDYYGTVTLTPTDGKHPPVSIAIVLNIVPAGANAAPGVNPTGVVFTRLTGSIPTPQTFVISNVTSRALTFTGTASQGFFDLNPKTGSIPAGQSQTITVSLTNAVVVAGVYRGSIQLNFGDNTSRTIDVLQVVGASTAPSANLSSSAGAGRGADGCTPARLLPVLTSVGAGFQIPLAWPTPIIVQVVDNCGTPINNGNVTASFTNGDVPLSLVSIGNGVWSATWVPVRVVPNTGIRADAQTGAPVLSGTVQVVGGVAANPKVPVVAAGGVLSSGDYMGAPAQGLLASIFGVALADGALGNSSLPLPPQLGSTLVLVSGVQVPMLFVSENQVNVFIPYELAVNAPHQLILQRGNAISVPVELSIFENQPAILATAGNGAGQGHVYKINAAGVQILADAAAPAKAGDVLVIYSVGLGPVNPPLKSGDPAPLTFLSPTTGTASVTIGGVPARVEFAGLTPGFSGLYQVNVTVPAGITPGNQVAVTVAVNGRAGAGNIFMAIQN